MCIFYFFTAHVRYSSLITLTSSHNHTSRTASRQVRWSTNQRATIFSRPLYDGKNQNLNGMKSINFFGKFWGGHDHFAISSFSSSDWMKLIGKQTWKLWEATHCVILWSCCLQNLHYLLTIFRNKLIWLQWQHNDCYCNANELNG